MKYVLSVKTNLENGDRWILMGPLGRALGQLGLSLYTNSKFTNSIFQDSSYIVLSVRKQGKTRHSDEEEMSIIKHHKVNFLHKSEILKR